MTRVDRRIRIYNAQVLGVDPTALNRAVKSNMQEVFEYIERLPFLSTATENTYLNDEEGKVLSMKIVDIDLTERLVKGRFAVTRRDLLPQIEQDGRITDPTIPTGAGYYDPTHFVYFLDTNRVAMEINGHGPHYGKFGEYLEGKLVTHPTINLVSAQIFPLISADIYRRLQVDGTIAEIEFEVYRGYSGVLSNIASGLGDVLTALDNLPEGPAVFAVSLKGDTADGRQRSIGEAVQEEVVNLLRDGRVAIRRAVAKVRQPNPTTGRNRTSPINLLEAKMVYYARPVQVRSRVLDSTSMFAEIITGYRNFVADEVR